MIKIKRRTKRYLIISGMIAAVIILAVLIVHGVGSLVRGDTDTSAGLEYIKQEESGSVAEIEAKINLLEKQDGEEGEDTRSIREKFNGAVVVGDSIAQGFTEFDVLNTSSVVSKIGVHLYELDDLISQVKEISPGTVFLAMGMNDLSATEGNVDESISQYAEVLKKVAEEVPDANVFVNSIFPAQENAIEDDPYLEHISEYNTALKELCDSRGIGFIDNTNLVEDKYYEEDGLHFKADFYPLWAEHMAEVAAL